MRTIAVRLLPCMVLGVLSILWSAGCDMGPSSGRGQGPGGRAQSLALAPAQEVSLGEQAYKAGRIAPPR